MKRQLPVWERRINIYNVDTSTVVKEETVLLKKMAVFNLGKCYLEIDLNVSSFLLIKTLYKSL